MTSKTKLRVGETGFIARKQMWLNNVEGHISLYVEPRFVSRAEAAPDMLRVDAMASRANPGSPYYRIHLPAKKVFGLIDQWVTRQEVAQRSLMHVPGVLIQRPSKQPFATPDFFYFTPKG